MIWRLTYCNKKGVEARVDIIKGDTTSVEIVKGSANPFTLSYKLDKNDKSGHIMTSSADIEFFETEEFNIDKLKTSNETELKVEYFENNVLTWSGFILPDFFSREIGSPNIVRMTASDRLTALKGVILSNLPAKISLRDLIELSLAQTGLSLALVAQIQINQGSTNILDSEILSQRLTDTRGRSISCYDILMSIMVATNSTIRQRSGQWVVYNKLEHEIRTPTIFFDKVERGAIRTIQPVASSVGVYQEFGGGRLHPDNYDFSQGLTGWTTVGGFSADTDNRPVKGYKMEAGVFVPDYGEGDGLSHLKNANPYQRNVNPIYLESAPISVPYSGSGAINIEFDINGVGPMWTTQAVMRIAIVAQKGSEILTLHHGGAFNPMPSVNPPVFEKQFKKGFLGSDLAADTQSMRVSGTLESDELEGWELKVRIYGGGASNTILINSVSLVMRSSHEVPNGNIFKTTQGSNYTKLHDVETTIFGDYITSGLNGYFYNYPIDDTSNLYLPSGELSSPTWITLFDTTERPLLHHTSRQKSRLFSVAHDILRANINVESFDPLAVFQDCKGEKYVVVSASFDFLRSEVDVELEQIAYDNTILKRDFIYSYFGEGEDTIKSIGGIAGGGGGTGGGGMTSEQLEMLTNLASWWKLDEENDAIYSEKSIYSLKGVSALGYGDGGGSGGGGIDKLDSWANYTTEKADYYVPASLLVPFRNDTLSRLDSLESGSATSITTTGSGNAITSLTKSGSVITADKGLTFALASHTHTIAQITGLQGALDSKSTPSDIDIAIDNIEIGGRNLIGYSFLKNNADINYLTGVELSSGARTIPTKFIKVSPNQRYTFVRPVNSGNVGTRYYDEDKNFITSINLGGGELYSFIIPSDTYYFKFIDEANTLEDGYILVKGDKLLTNYNPAPEDQVSDWSVTDVNSFAFIKNKPTQLSQFTDNIGIGSHIANKANPHEVTTSQIGAVDLTTNQNIGGNKTFTGNVVIKGAAADSPLKVRGIDGYIDSTGLLDNLYLNYVSTKDISMVMGGGNVGIGTTSPAYKLDVSGTGRFTGNVTAPKFISPTNIGGLITPIGTGWSQIWGMEGYELTNATTPNANFFGIATQYFTPTRHIGFFGNGVENAWIGLHDGSAWFRGNVTASASVNTPKVDFGNGFTIEPSGTELVFKYNGVIKQRILSDGTILATGGVTALATS